MGPDIPSTYTTDVGPSFITPEVLQVAKQEGFSDVAYEYGADVIELFVTAGGSDARQQAGEVKIG